MHRTSTFILLTALSASCSDHRRPELRAALDEAQLSLRESVPIALNAAQSTSAQRGSIVLGAPIGFGVSAILADHLEEVRIDGVSARVTSMTRANLTATPCSGAIALDVALAIAENEVGGEAVSSVLDDDEACALEIQVLVGDVLHEVKVAADGKVLETELSDELNGGDGD